MSGTRVGSWAALLALNLACGRTSGSGDTLVSLPARCEAACPLDRPACDDGACVVRGPELVPIDDFYIDSTEVTIGQYLEFVDAVTGAAPEWDNCSWNHELLPANAGVPDDARLPMTNVDWCDAFSYCQWADKHLCGSIDRARTLDEPALADPDASQWFRACAGPRGETSPDADDTCSAGPKVALKPAASATCEGPYAGVFDLGDNAAEWVETCVGNGVLEGEFDSCFFSGGSNQGPPGCTSSKSWYARGNLYDWLGFRCCSG